jgi:hypothetical protein
MVAHGRLSGVAAIGVRIGKVLNKYKVGKHFELNITDQSFDFSLREDKIADEAALDGVYVIRTDVSKRKMSADDTVRNYKSLNTVDVLIKLLLVQTSGRWMRAGSAALGVGTAVPLDDSGSCRKAIVPTMPIAA